MASDGRETSDNALVVKSAYYVAGNKDSAPERSAPHDGGSGEDDPRGGLRVDDRKTDRANADDDFDDEDNGGDDDSNNAIDDDDDASRRKLVIDESTAAPTRNDDDVECGDDRWHYGRAFLDLCVRLDEILETHGESSTMRNVIRAEMLHRCAACAGSPAARETLLMKLRLTVINRHDHAYRLGAPRMHDLLATLGARPAVARDDLGGLCGRRLHEALGEALRVSEPSARYSADRFTLSYVAGLLHTLDARSNEDANATTFLNIGGLVSRVELRWLVLTVLRRTPVTYVRVPWKSLPADAILPNQWIDAPRCVQVRDRSVRFPPGVFVATFFRANSRNLQVHYVDGQAHAFNTRHRISKWTDHLTAVLRDYLGADVRSCVLECLVGYVTYEDYAPEYLALIGATSECRVALNIAIQIIDCAYVNGRDMRCVELSDRVAELANVVPRREGVFCRDTTLVTLCPLIPLCAVDLDGPLGDESDGARERVMVRLIYGLYKRETKRWIMRRGATYQTLRLVVLGAWSTQGHIVNRVLLGCPASCGDFVTVVSAIARSLPIALRREINRVLEPYEEKRHSWLRVSGARSRPAAVVRRDEMRWLCDVEHRGVCASGTHSAGVSCRRVVLVTAFEAARPCATIADAWSLDAETILSLRARLVAATKDRRAMRSGEKEIES